MSNPLDSFVAVPISCELYARLATRFPARVSTLVEEVLHNFLDRTAAEDGPASPQGMRWEGLFLPSSTLVRTTYHGEHKQGIVIEGKIVWEGDTYRTFGSLANAMRGNTSNNAWKVLELKRPNDMQWQPAYLLRV
jgi:hypothetical protein